jgi:hypothetical protein
VAFALVIGAGFSFAGYVYRPGVPEPNYESVSRYLATTTNPDDPIYVWGSVPEIYWASERRPATRFLTSPFLTGNYPGRPPEDANTGSDTETAWELFYDDFKAHPPKYFAREGARRAVLPDLRLPPSRAHHRHAVQVRRHHRRHRRLPPPVTPFGAATPSNTGP